jgi:hypothetical protein
MQSIVEELNAENPVGQLLPEDQVKAIVEKAFEVPSTPLIQVKLKREDFIHTQDFYKGSWNLFFINKKWFYAKNNGVKLGSIFPTFAVVEFSNNPIRGLQSTDVRTELNNLFAHNYVVLPFKIVTANKLVFLGIHLNKLYSSSTTIQVNNYTILTHMIGVYGYFETWKYTKYFNSITRAPHYTEWDTTTTSGKKFFPIFKQCETQIQELNMEI